MRIQSSIAVVIVATVLMSGCVPGGKQASEAARFCAKARAYAEQQNFQAAAAEYQKALQVSPELPDVHLDLALLYTANLSDPIAAIYHYRQHLALRPDSAKRQMVEDAIERAKLSIAAKVPNSPIVDPAMLVKLQDEKAMLTQENERLKSRIAELEKAVAELPAVMPPSTPAVAPPPTAPPAGPRTHIVEKGDTLQSLALRYYGTRSAWTRIYEANRSGLPTPDQVKIGQTLVIP